MDKLLSIMLCVFYNLFMPYTFVEDPFMLETIPGTMDTSTTKM